MAETMSDDLVQNLLPTLIQCFGTIFLGFVFGKAKILHEESAKGLCIFLHYLSLPSLIFVSLATLSLNHVKWEFVAAILVAKIIVFLLVIVITMVLTRPLHLGKSGIYAIAATQSNDLALGYPLMVSLYKNIYQEYPQIVYFVVPIQLLLLNPAGFFMIETYKQLNDPAYHKNHKLYTILKEILKNPVIMMTILGLTWNLAFSHHIIPPVISQLLDALGSVFSTLALFSLGFGMSIKRNVQRRNFSLSSGLIVLAKILLLPLILQRVTVYMMSGNSESERQNLSSLGFLYGTIPIAPSVFVFAKHYDIAVNTITSATVYSTLFSAPLMLTSAMMISFNQDNIVHYDYYLNKAISYTGAINLFSCILLAFIFLLRRIWHDIYNIGLIYVIFAQSLSSTAAVLLFFYTETNNNMFYAGYFLQTIGLHCTYMYTVLSALLVFLLQWKSLCYVLRYRTVIQVAGFILPAIISIVIAFCLPHTKYKNATDYFDVGKPQHITTLAISITTFLSTAFLLMFSHRHHVKNVYLSINNKTELADDSSDISDESESLIKERVLCDRKNCCRANNTSDESGPSENIESIAVHFKKRSECSKFCSSAQGCSRQQRIQCAHKVENYQNELSTHTSDFNSFTYYKCSMIFLLSLCCCMLLDIAESLSKTLADTRTGAFIELQFLNIVLRNGQGILCLCLFSFQLWPQNCHFFHKICSSRNPQQET